MKQNVYFASSCYWDTVSATIVKADGTSHSLTQKEETLLKTLVANTGAMLSHDSLIKAIWGDEYYSDTYLNKSLRDLISRTRKIDSSLGECIVSRKGLGYQFKAPTINNAPSEKNNSISHMTLSDINEKLGMSNEEVAKALVANDFALYGDLGTCEGDWPVWKAFLDAYPQTFQFLVKSSNIIGNWSMLCPSEKHIELIERGRIEESHFKPSDTECLLIPKKTPFVGYLLNFSVNIGYQTPENLRMLFNSFATQLFEWSNYGIYFSLFYVNIFRSDMEPIFRALGFKEKHENVPHGKIFSLNMTQLPDFGYWNDHKELKKKYDAYFSTTAND